MHPDAHCTQLFVPSLVRHFFWSALWIYNFCLLLSQNLLNAPSLVSILNVVGCSSTYTVHRRGIEMRQTCRCQVRHSIDYTQLIWQTYHIFFVPDFPEIRNLGKTIIFVNVCKDSYSCTTCSVFSKQRSMGPRLTSSHIVSYFLRVTSPTSKRDLASRVDFSRKPLSIGEGHVTWRHPYRQWFWLEQL